MIVAAPHMEGVFKFSGLNRVKTYWLPKLSNELGQASPLNQGGRHPPQENIYSRRGPKRLCDKYGTDMG